MLVNLPNKELFYRIENRAIGGCAKIPKNQDWLSDDDRTCQRREESDEIPEKVNDKVLPDSSHFMY